MPQDQFQREERRLIIALGFLATFIAIRPLTAGVVVFYVKLDVFIDWLLIPPWLFYGLFMWLWFSDDLFKRGRIVFHALGLASLAIQIFAVLLLFGVTAIVVYSPPLPPWLGPYLILAYTALVALGIGRSLTAIYHAEGLDLLFRKSVVGTWIRSLPEFLSIGSNSVGEALIRSWRKLAEKTGHPIRGPFHIRRALRFLNVTLGSVVVILTWWTTKGWDLPWFTEFGLLAWSFVGTLLLIGVGLIVVGRNKLSQSPTKESTPDPLAEPSSLKVFIAYGGTTANKIGLEIADCLSKAGIWPRIAATGSRWSIGITRQELIFREELTCQAVVAINTEGSYEKVKFWDEVALAKYETKPPIPVIAFLRDDGGDVVMLLRVGCRRIHFNPNEHDQKCQELAQAIREEVGQAGSAKTVHESEQLPVEPLEEMPR